MNKRTYVVLLNWRGWRDTIACLESLFGSERAGLRVIVCDNDSGDGSLERIIDWALQFLPRDSELSFQVWVEVDQKIAKYIRGKFIEIAIVWAVTYVTFAFMGLDFSLLLSFLVGISVIIPFVGAIAVTFPVAIIAYVQWGLAADFWYLLLAYQIIQILDGNVLVPLQFSEVVDMHPAAIIIAVLVFGGLWGVWGVFFAIPLATLIQAVLNAWPSMQTLNSS